MKEYSIREIKAIEERLEQTIQKLDKLQKQAGIEPFIDNSDFIRIFKISNSTAKNWRSKGLIAYCQIENKIYYKKIDIEKLLLNNYNTKNPM